MEPKVKESPKPRKEAPPLNADRAPFPDDFEHGEPSTDIADLGLPAELEAELRGDHA